MPHFGLVAAGTCGTVTNRFYAGGVTRCALARTTSIGVVHMKRFFCIFVTCIGLAACGGGGGGTGTPTVPLPTATPTPTPAPPTQQSERADAQQALSAYQAAGQLGGGSGTTVLSAARKVQVALRKPSALRKISATSACTNNTISTTTQTSPTSETITVDTYYDSLCTALKSSITWNASFSGSTVSGPFTFDEYTQSGTQTGYVTGTLSIMMNSTGTSIVGLSIQMTDIATTPAAPSQGQFAIACSESTSVTCGTAAIADMSAGGEQGVNLNFSASSSAGTTGGTNVSATLNAQAFTSAAGTMSITAGTFPSWSISGGTLYAALNGNLSVAYSSAGVATSLNATFTDPQYDTTVALTQASSGITGTITRGSVSYATFSVDNNGNGTITYDNGTTGQIENWLIVS